LHPIWATIECHAERLDRLYCQQTGVTFDVVPGQRGGALAATIPLAEPGSAVRVWLEGSEVRYHVMRNGELVTSRAEEARVDRGVYLLLAELAEQR
jgi:hypothetical protein